MEKKLAGLVVMSGYLPNHTNLQVTTGMGDLPILHCHGKQDPLVRYHYAEHGRKYLVEQQVSKLTVGWRVDNSHREGHVCLSVFIYV